MHAGGGCQVENFNALIRKMIFKVKINRDPGVHAAEFPRAARRWVQGSSLLAFPIPVSYDLM
jgi:hypothetical protein